MKIISCGAAMLLAAGAIALARPTTVHAQDTAKVAKPGSVSVAAEVGAQDFDRLTVPAPNQLQLGKFLEYRDFKTGLVIPQFLLSYTPKDGYGTYQISGRNALQLDQSFWARFSRPGSYDMQIRYDGIPHTFSTDARSLGNFGNGTLYALPTPRPDSNAWRGAPYIAPIRTIWDPLKVSLGLTPSPSWDTKFEYSHVSKTGGRPIGMALGGPSNTTRETPEPIDQTTQDFRLSQSYTQPRFQASASYDLSMFQNAFNSMSTMNPQQVADTKTAGAAVGRLALAPNNSAQTASAFVAGNFPLRTRVVASGTYSWWAQNEPFIPPTSNSVYFNDPNYLPSRTSLDGRVTTTVFNASLSSHPLKDLSVSARFRSFQYKNNTDSVVVDTLVISDRSLSGGATTAYVPHSTTDYSVGATYRVLPNVHLGASVAWQTMTRDSAERNVVTTNETTPKVSVDFTGLDWVTLRASYLTGSRRGSAYHIIASNENPTFRRFDEADRNRERTNFEAEFNPTDQFGFSLTWQVGHDGYPNSLYGVQSDKSIMAGASLEWTPSSRFSMNVGYSREDYNNFLKQQYRTGSVDSTLNNPSWVWLNNNTDHINNTFAGFTAVLEPGKWEAGGSISMSDATFMVADTNPLTPVRGTASQLVSATAINFPPVSQQLHPMSFYLRYIYNPDWALTLRYNVESYTQDDWRTQTLTPAIGTTGNHFNLASYYRNYNIGWMSLMISWHPSLLKYGMARSTM
jgi:MtrB/PioB family decaheme-associated outer membrane protein